MIALSKCLGTQIQMCNIFSLTIFNIFWASFYLATSQCPKTSVYSL